jgi:hypothetical protein
MTDTADMMLSLADAIEKNGNPNDMEATLVLDPEQSSWIVQSLRDKAASMQVAKDRPVQANEHQPGHPDLDELQRHVEAALHL